MRRSKNRLCPFRLYPFVCLLVFGLVLLGGCAAVGPNYQKPKTPMPESWQLASDPALIRNESQVIDWWMVFNDPFLTQLIEDAASGNLSLKAALARVEEARAQVWVARGMEVPSVNLGANATWQRGSEYSLPPGGSTNTSNTIGLDAGWEIDLFGRIRRSVEAAQANYEATEEDRLDVMVTLYSEVARTYLTVRTLQARLSATQSNIESQKRILWLVQSRFNNGLATALEVAQAQMELASSQAEVPPLKIALEQNINTIALLLGKQPGAYQRDLKIVKPIPIPPQKVTVGVPANLLRQRPDIRRAERQLATQTARIGVATADLYPTFSLTGSFGFSATDLRDIPNYGSRIFTFGPALQWNIFDGGRIRSQIKVEDARTEQALLNYEQTVLAALNETENALVGFLNQRQRVSALERSVQASSRALKLALDLYKEGLTDFENVLDAQRNLFVFSNQLAEAKGTLTVNLVNLYKAIGGGWHPQQVSSLQTKDRAPSPRPQPKE